MESTSQVTVVTEFPVTVAVKAWLWLVVRAAREGLMATEAAPVEGGGVVAEPPPQPDITKAKRRSAEMNTVF
jgi:hypothetical protein